MLKIVSSLVNAILHTNFITIKIFFFIEYNIFILGKLDSSVFQCRIDFALIMHNRIANCFVHAIVVTIISREKNESRFGESTLIDGLESSVQG